jgi:hypothetical protein
MKGFFFLLTNSILLLGPGDHFDFIFPGKRQKMAAPQTNTKDARAEKGGDDGRTETRGKTERL